MMLIYADTALSDFPGMGVADMEVGGICFDENGEIRDVAEMRKDPDRVFFDPNNADTGYIGVRLDDDAETDADRDSRIFGQDDSDPSVVECKTLHEQDELHRLIVEQGLDDHDDIRVKTKQRKKISTCKYHEQESETESGKPRKYSDRGRNDRYKNHRQTKPIIFH